MTTTITENTKAGDNRRFAVLLYTGRGDATRRRVLAAGWCIPSRDYLCALMHGASLAAWAGGTKHPTVAAYVRDVRDGDGAPWILCEEHDHDDGRNVPRWMTPDLSDGVDPVTGKTFSQLRGRNVAFA